MGVRFIVKGAELFSDQYVKVRNAGLSDVLPEMSFSVINTFMLNYDAQ